MNGFSSEHSSTIDDLIFVDDKIVTYKSLAKQLGCHINISKQALYLYIKEKESVNLCITYLIAGTPEKAPGQKVLIVKAAQLGQVKKTFKNIISEHVYSVQKIHPSLKPAEIYLAHNDVEITENDWKNCSIKAHPNITCVKRKQTVPEVKEVVEGIKENKVLNTKPYSKKVDLKREEPKMVDTKEESHKKEEPIKERTPLTSYKKVPVTKNKLKDSVAKGAGHIGVFFSNQATKTRETKPQSPPKKVEEVQKLEALTEKEGNVQDSTLKSSLPKKEEITTPKKSKKKAGESKRKKGKDELNSKNRKRRRIQVAIDSESSEEEGEEVMELEEALPSPINDPAFQSAPHALSDDDEECIPPTPVVKGRKRIRKQVDKTYTDEDGFILTKKEYIYESCSDDENTPSEKNEAPTPLVVAAASAPSPGKKKKAITSPSPTKNKQASIISFFKKN